MDFLHWKKTFIDHLNHIEKKKHILKIRIVKYLYLNGQKSNAELCQWLMISSPTSITLLNELMKEGLVEKRGRGESSGGRKPDLYTLRDNCIFVLAIDMGKYKTDMAIFNNNNVNISGTKRLSLKLEDGMNAVDLLHEQAVDLIQSSGINSLQLMGIGISMPGLLDAVKGTSYTYFNFDGISLRQLLEKKFDLPVYIENDAKARTLAEYRFGLAQNKEHVLAIFLDWGIGLGIIQDGKLYRGATGFAGEFGHIPMVENGQLCTCGKQGCLETIASGTELVKLAIKGLKMKKSSILSDFSDEDLQNLEPSMIVEAALRGDQYSISILGEIGFNLGKAISILIQLYNPEIIILGGKLAQANRYLTIPIKQALNVHCMQQLVAHTSIKISELGTEAGILGSIAIVMENIFE